MKRRIEITVETKRVLLMTRRSSSLNAWCAACGEDVPMLTPEEAGLLAGVTARAIYGHAEDGRVHFTETTDGALLICSGSVEKMELHSEADEQ